MNGFTIRGDRPAKRIQEAFEAEAIKRDQRELSEWEHLELLAVWKATNEERAKLGKGPVPISRVERAEIYARGHVDYSMKLAIYCEELVKEGN